MTAFVQDPEIAMWGERGLVHKKEHVSKEIGENIYGCRGGELLIRISQCWGLRLKEAKKKNLQTSKKHVEGRQR